MNGQSAVVFMYLGEFQPTEYRDKMLSWMEMAWVVGMIILAGKLEHYNLNFCIHST